METSKKMQSVKQVLDETYSLLKAKDADYGSSAHKVFDKAVQNEISPYLMLYVRLADKFNRFENLIFTDNQQVKTENIDDTLADLMGYITLFKGWQKESQNEELIQKD